MNNTFSFSRFGRYFKYDLRRWVSTYGATLLLMAAVPVILYTLTGVYSLLFSGEWSTPGETTRIIIGVIFSAIMVITYPASVYGYITDKRAGSAFILIPASVFEKFLSMLLNTVVIVPLVFGIIYMSLDGLICSLFSSAARGIEALATFAFASDAPIHVSILSLYLGSAATTLFFLLGAIFFRKHKILYPILIVIGFQMVFSMLFGILIDMDHFMTWGGRLAERFLMNPDFMSWAIPAYNVLATLWDIIVFAALAAAVYFRLKTIKH